MAIKKLCDRCEKIIDIGHRYCKECEDSYKEINKKNYRKYNKYKRDKKKQKFYDSKEWRTISNIVKSKDFGLCQVCLNKNIVKSSDVVHHIIPLDEDRNKALDRDNLICLCHKCHNKIHNDMKDNSKKKLIEEKLFELIEGRG